MAENVSLGVLEENLGKRIFKDGERVWAYAGDEKTAIWNNAVLNESYRSELDISIISRIENAVNIVNMNYGDDYNIIHSDGRSEVKKSWMGDLTASQMARKIYRGIEYTRNTIIGENDYSLITLDDAQISNPENQKDGRKHIVSKSQFDEVVIASMISQIGVSIPEVLLKGAIKDYSNTYATSYDNHRQLRELQKSPDLTREEEIAFISKNIDGLTTVADRFKANMGSLGRDIIARIEDPYTPLPLHVVEMTLYAIASPIMLGVVALQSIGGKALEKSIENNLGDLSSFTADKLQAVKNSPGLLWGKLKEVVGSIKEKVAQTWKTEVTDKINNAVDKTVNTLDQKALDINNYVDSKYNDAKGFIVDKVNDVKNTVDLGKSKIADSVTSVQNEIIQGAIVINKGYNNTRDKVNNVVDGVVAVKNKVEDKITHYTEVGKAIKDGVTDKISEIDAKMHVSRGIKGLNDAYSGLITEIEEKNKPQPKVEGPSLSDKAIDGAINVVGLIAKTSGELLNRLEAKRNLQKESAEAKANSGSKLG